MKDEDMICQLEAEKEALLKKIETVLERSASLERKRDSLEKECESLEKKVEEQSKTIADLRQLMEWLRRKVFGKMSEKLLPKDPSFLEPTLFDQPLPEDERKALDEEVEKMDEEEAKSIEVKAHKREVRKPVAGRDLPVVVVADIYPEGIGEDYVEIGVENSDRLAVAPAELYIERTVRHKFVLKSSLQVEDPERRAFKTAPLPETALPKCMASESLLADILIDKYVYHLPFHRQIQKYKELGVVLSAATVGDWFAAVCARLRPLCEKLRERIMAADYIQVDESTLPVIDNDKHRAARGYVWAVRDAVAGDVYFHYDHGSRSGDTARKLIGAYRGAVQTDGYEVYDSYENAPGKLMLGCWAHVRRKFFEAREEDRRHADEALVYIGKLYRTEDEMAAAGLDAEAVRLRRVKESYPVIQAFERWLQSVSTLPGVGPKTMLGKAVVYAYTLLPRLGRYVLDGKYKIDNNGVENAIRPLAVGRKNYLFCGNDDAAVRASIAYSFFGSCKAHDVDSRKWLEDVLRRLPSEKDIAALLPANWQPSEKISR